MSSRPGAAWPLVAVFTAGYLASYLLPTVVGRLSAHLGLSPAQAGLVGSALLLSSAGAGFALAGRVERFGARTPARAGLVLAAVGYGCAALAGSVPLVVLGVMVGGFGSGTATAVAASGIAARRDPHRTSSLGLLTVSATAGVLYLTIPHLGGGHRLPFAAIALVALLVWPATARLDGARTAEETSSPVTGRLPHRRSGLVLAGGMLVWSMAQNALWGVSSRIGVVQAGLSEVTVGAVFAAALGAGLLGVTGAGLLGARLGRAVPIGLGTVVIAASIVLSSSARDLGSFATGEIMWNTVYPVVLSYLIGLAASLDVRGRWAVLAGSASSVGVACGPLLGSVLSEEAGYPAMGLILGAATLLVAAPVTAVALHTGGRPLVPGSVRRRGGAPAALLAATTGGGLSGAVPKLGSPEQPVTELRVRRRRLVRSAIRTAGPDGGSGQSNAYASTSDR
ncbi:MULTISPECIES: MFS transporter [Streptomyces]|uniref:MFS transporter n=3 Tax=Streptomyces TaxID=1883 RepID=A0AAU8KGR3_9ACTN|nr:MULTISPECIES: MFS transporter [Streptomyces]WDT91579.1 MFS transporter [Streptomyces sp. SCSIO-PteL053]KAA6197508.1 MFS transporter [Streptomyces parvus]PJN34251.1 MFS transporter [Streptomyces sp. CB02613]PVC87081.1 MFS transporter [Streptomyces sp. CS131]SCE44892.1 Predicted arabinose efflux permease, MFS family [Streptomyces sp. Termitarium-T10T-6]